MKLLRLLRNQEILKAAKPCINSQVSSLRLRGYERKKLGASSGVSVNFPKAKERLTARAMYRNPDSSNLAFT